MPACPKHKRVVDKKVYQEVRDRDGTCLWGLIAKDGCVGMLAPHHIKTRGAGGDDAKENMIVLCKKHHDEAHAHKISPQQLFDLLTFFYGYLYVSGRRQVLSLSTSEG
jgi:hypothetical protein